MKKSVAIILSVVCLALLVVMFYLEITYPAGGKAFLDAIKG
jgi:uncharacterized membrane protein